MVTLEHALTGLVQEHVVASRSALATSFLSASPFPHLVIDDFLSDALCNRLLAEFPAFENGCAVNEHGRPGGKAVFERVRTLGPAFSEVDDLIQTRQFLELIGDITGINELLYDPDYIGGGTHENRANQELDPHIDFNFHPRRGWHRRLNLIVYLNPVWEDCWGGALELHADPWRRDSHEGLKTVLPLKNRCVIFETSERSWHGFRRITPPSGHSSLSRRSFAIYLYSKDRPAAEAAAPHSTIYVDRPLPDHLRAGTILSDEDVRTIESLIGRRCAHADRLVRREHQFAEMIQRDIQGIVNEHKGELTDKHVDTLRWLIARQDEHLKYLYDREKQFTHRLQDLEKSDRAHLPLRGAMKLVSDVQDYWADRWTGTSLCFRARAMQDVNALRITGNVPAGIVEGQDLVLTAGNGAWSCHVGIGSFEWSVPLTLNEGTECLIRVSANHHGQPSSAAASADDRELAWHMSEIEAV